VDRGERLGGDLAGDPEARPDDRQIAALFD
jgi:hypothetical protein